MPVDIKPETAEGIEQLAKTLVELENSVRKLMRSGLTENAIVLLVAESSGVGRADTRKVLAALQELRRTYTTIK